MDLCYDEHAKQKKTLAATTQSFPVTKATTSPTMEENAGLTNAQLGKFMEILRQQR